MKKLYRVDYDGLWLGGTALVFAGSEQEAINLVESDDFTVDFKDVEVKELPLEGVVYNDNGDY